MRRWCCVVGSILLVAGTTSSVVGQLEQQTPTHDLTLDDCLAQAFRRSPEIQQLQKEVDRAAGTQIVDRSRALPQLNGSLTAGLRGGNLYNGPDTRKDPDTGVISTNRSREFNPTLFSAVSAQFSQPLIDLGIPSSLRRGRLEIVIAQQNLNREVTDRLYDARVAFLRALYLRDLIRIHEEIARQLDANVTSEQQRLDAGTGTKQAVASANVQKLNLALTLSNLRGEYVTTLTRIDDLCGLNLKDDTGNPGQLWFPKPVGDMEYAPVTVDLSRESAYALAHRADLKLLDALVDATAADKQSTEAGYFPVISLIGSALFIPENYLLTRQTQIVVGQQTESSEGRVGVALSWQVIDNGQITGASHQLEAIRQEYVIDRRKLQQDIPRELVAVKNALQTAEARHDALAKSATAAEENLKLIEAQIRLGQATQLDFLKAQTDLLSVRAGVADATYVHEVARANLDRVMGRYLQFHSENAP
ncbi:MAG TPA: TolC family protein [Verrucomicrobiae bacterium]|nr:TolC family protein [Verrucomicrobiae bacterium]